MDEPILNTLVQAGVIEKYEIKMQDDSEVLTFTKLKVVGSNPTVATAQL